MDRNNQVTCAEFVRKIETFVSGIVLKKLKSFACRHGEMASNK